MRRQRKGAHNNIDYEKAPYDDDNDDDDDDDDDDDNDDAYSNVSGEDGKDEQDNHDAMRMMMSINDLILHSLYESIV